MAVERIPDQDSSFIPIVVHPAGQNSIIHYFSSLEPISNSLYSNDQFSR